MTQQQSKYAKRFDRSRDHGTYHPADQGAFYNQDGYDFDHEGYIVEARLTDAQRERLAKKPPAQAPGKPKPPAPVQKQEGGEGEGDSTEGEGGGDTLNLELWLRGEADYNLDAVRHAVKDRFSVWKTGKRDLVLFLVEDQKLVEGENLSDEFKAVVA